MSHEDTNARENSNAHAELKPPKPEPDEGAKSGAKWRANLGRLGRELATGDFRLEDLLRVLTAIPPGILTRLGKDSPLLRRKSLGILASTIGLKGKAKTPAGSQALALASEIGRKMGATIQINELLVASARLLKQNAQSGKPVDKRILAGLDSRTKALLRSSEDQGDLLAKLESCLAVARQTGDAEPLRSLSAGFEKQPLLPENFTVKDLRLPVLKQFLLENWTRVQGWEPRVGLCEFTEQAMCDYWQFRLDPLGKRHRPFSPEQVMKVTRSLDLVCSNPATINRVEVLHDHKGNPLLDRVHLYRRGGQKLVHQLSPQKTPG